MSENELKMINNLCCAQGVVLSKLIDEVKELDPDDPIYEQINYYINWKQQEVLTNV